jgi:hypothetical protein
MSERAIQQKLDFATKTWRYLRIAIVLLVVGLVIAVVYEAVDGGCGRLLTSISAYYYTPVHAYFVGALVSIGVCLFCIKGSTEWEDVALNFAGVCAPVVALVPTPNPDCSRRVLFTQADIDASVANNITALFAIGAVGFLLAAYFSRRDPPAHTAVIGFRGVAGVFVAAVVWFYADRDAFVHCAHLVSAALMFGSIVVVVWINAVGYRQRRGKPFLGDVYYTIAITMVAVTVGLLIARCAGWRFWLLALEGALIILFAIFWMLQTGVELWDERHGSAGDQADGAPAEAV